MNHCTKVLAPRVSHRLAPFALLLGGWLALVGSAHAADVFHGFDTDTEGVSVFGAQLTAANGYLALQDIDGYDIVVELPTADLGDWSRFLGGSYSFDAINLNGADNDWISFGTLRIESGNQALELDFVPYPAPASTWTTYSVNLDTATWGQSLTSVLSNVTRVGLSLESHIGFDPATTGYEFNGLDNIRVSAPVPEPQTWAMMGLGLVGVAAAARRRRLPARNQA